MPLTLLDTTILSNFAHGQCPAWVRLALGNQAAIPPAVQAELQQGEALGLVPQVDWSWLERLVLTPAEQKLADGYLAVLDQGEAECLAVAIARGGRFVSDDLAARRFAQVNGVVVSGTIGLLLCLVQDHHIPLSAADAVLDLMRQQGYRAPTRSLAVYL